MREGWISADERRQLEELRAMTLDAIMVDDFDPEELRSASYAELHGRLACNARRRKPCTCSMPPSPDPAGRAGRWLFSRLVCWKAPYFRQHRAAHRIAGARRGVASIAHRRKVTNHIGTVHAIALCNLAEFVGGLTCEVSIPRDMRWIPKGMDVLPEEGRGPDARGGPPAFPLHAADAGYELPFRWWSRTRRATR